ncbi:hypothetical protein [Streptomyces sp. NPDC057623]|uniref:hypothetical protein n=1 Tax=Streptomyces sp. NPDC057623 TaxID=3346187 RepID=UPI0036AE94E7
MLALRWLRGEALRIADRLDPDPARSPWLHRPDVQPFPPGPDAPTELRAWATDLRNDREARVHIKGGHALFVRVSDPDCTYALSVRPVRLSRAASPAEAQRDGSRTRAVTNQSA